MKMKHGRWYRHGWRNFSPIAIAGMVIGGIVLGVVLAFLFGWVVMLLWNWLMPAIFGLPVISYWQGWGIVLLSQILLKGGWRSAGPGHGKHRGPRGGHGPRGGYSEPCDGEDDSWCQDCSSCDAKDSCRPFARGWVRTANGWSREKDEVKKDIADRMGSKEE